MEEFVEALVHRLLLVLCLNDGADPLCCLVLTQLIVLCLKGSRSLSNHEMSISDNQKLLFPNACENIVAMC